MSSLQAKCNKILNDDSIDEDDKVEKVEDLVKSLYSEKSPSDLERLVLDILWKHREGTLDEEDRGQPVVVERKPVAQVQKISAPLPSDLSKLESRRPPVGPGSFTAHQPQLSTNRLEGSITRNEYHQDWNYSSSSEQHYGEEEENYAQDSMSPFDILRGVLGEENTDEDIHSALEYHDFDISRTLDHFRGDQSSKPHESQNSPPTVGFESAKPFSVGSLVSSIDSLEDKSKIMCKYFVQYGECLRADCMYSHDLSSRICRYWLRGSCLAGESCLFLHSIPDSLANQADEDGLDHQHSSRPQKYSSDPVSFTEDDFPALGVKPASKAKAGVAAATSAKTSWNTTGVNTTYGGISAANRASGGQKTAWSETGSTANISSMAWQRSKPQTALKPADTKPAFKFNPQSAFVPKTLSGRMDSPTFNSAEKAAASNSSYDSTASKLQHTKPKLANRAKVEIKIPKHVPWKDPGYRKNSEYLAYRNAAARHGDMRNKYLQLAADNWKRNNAAQASKFSKQGQDHNDSMCDAYQNGADLLMEQAYSMDNDKQKKEKQGQNDCELFLDLHGMTLEESVARLSEVLTQVEQEEEHWPRPIYVICSIGHHYIRNPNAEDKLTKTVKLYADKFGYLIKDFGSDAKFGRVLGIDPWSHF